MNRWYFWVLAPVMLTTGLGLPFIVDPPTWQGHLVLYVLCGTLIVATFGLASPRRFGWAIRAVAAVVLLAYAAYAATETVAWWHGKPFGLASLPAQSNLFNALRGLVVFGLPSMYLLLTGRSYSAVDVLLAGEDDDTSDAEARVVGDERDEFEESNIG
jgi:hypothetical protein